MRLFSFNKHFRYFFSTKHFTVTPMIVEGVQPVAPQKSEIVILAINNFEQWGYNLEARESDETLSLHHLYTRSCGPLIMQVSGKISASFLLSYSKKRVNKVWDLISLMIKLSSSFSKICKDFTYQEWFGGPKCDILGDVCCARISYGDLFMSWQHHFLLVA